MHTQKQYRGLIRTVKLLVLGATATFSLAQAAQVQGVPEPPSASRQEKAPEPDQHLSEEVRASIDKLVIIAGVSPTSQEIRGSYEKATHGLVGGMDAGSRAATIEKDIGGVPVNLPIPYIKWPAAIIGGIAGASQREVQEFRDALTEDLAEAADQPLTSDGLATDVYFALQKVPGLDTRLFAPTTPMPSDTDAILFVNVNNVAIDVQGKDAILTTTAGITLRRLSDGEKLHDTEIHYQDRDTLGNWTKNDNELWRKYANFARHYLGREISADAFDRIELRHEFQPVETDTVARVKRNEWQGSSRSTTPTLAWELILLGDDEYGPWTKSIDESAIYYDVEIYDSRELVYAENQVPDPRHTLVYEIEPCKTYRWSVRPSYRVGSKVKFGEWMRKPSATETENEAEVLKGIVGRKASLAPAYTQDFASLEIKCSRR